MHHPSSLLKPLRPYVSRPFASRALPLASLLVLAAACGGDDEKVGGTGGAAGSNAEAGAGGTGAASSGGSSAVAGAAGAPGAGSGGAAAAAGTNGDAGASGGDLLVDDFEDGDGTSLLGAGWYAYNDQPGGGASVITVERSASGLVASGPGYNSLHSLQADLAFDQGTLPYEPYLALGVSLRQDLSQYAALSYTYQGVGHTVRIETSGVGDYDYHGFVVPDATTWRTVTIAFNDLRQEGWGARVAFDPATATALSWHIRGATGETGSLSIDDVRILREGPPPVADMVVRDPEPPADEVIDSVEIATDLQAKAMRDLDQGYNITNWLEQERFDGTYTYDESYVEKLAAAGFESLRLPIDLDLYIDAVATAENGALTLSADLFELLDNFDAWTSTHGLSFVIDYHQYDHSFLADDADSVAEFVELWRQVAAHFASSPRDDLYYELLNEPELSAGGTPPTQEQWTTIANQAIAAIRESDTARTIIFGDVRWYDIDKLVARAPLEDTNVVYAFHFYEPFIFTHQGASWANMASTHDIPYPYSTDRVTEYSSDLGFSPLMESWILSSIRNYYRTGNKSALRNRIIQVKRWAVTNQVPVICNEFGVHDATSRLEDRERYYTDLIDIFAELEIPWQIWFMIMNRSTGAVIPEYQTAFRLAE